MAGRDNRAESSLLTQCHLVGCKYIQAAVVRDAWERKPELSLHGCNYGMSDGLLRDLQSSTHFIKSSKSANLNAVSSPPE
jgi:hypothetical protein